MTTHYQTLFRRAEVELQFDPHGDMLAVSRSDLAQKVITAAVTNRQVVLRALELYFEGSRPAKQPKEEAMICRRWGHVCQDIHLQLPERSTPIPEELNRATLQEWAAGNVYSKLPQEN